MAMPGLVRQKRHEWFATALAWSPDGHFIASANWHRSRIVVWNAANGRTKMSLFGHTNDIAALAWSPDGTRLASGSWDKTVRIWDAQSGQTLGTYDERRASLLADEVAWSPDGERLAVAGEEHEVLIWAVGSGQTLLIYRGHQEPVMHLAWAPARHLASASFDTVIQVWDPEAGCRSCRVDPAVGCAGAAA